MISHLLQYDQQTSNQVLMLAWIWFTHVDVVIKRSSHYAWVFITKGSFHLDFKLLNGHDLVKLYHDHHSFFPNHLVLMSQKIVDHILHGHNHLLIDNLGKYCQRR